MAAATASDPETAGAAAATAAALPPPPQAAAGRALNSLHVLWQCAVALLLCAPLMLASSVAWLPLSVLSWLAVEYFELRRKAAPPEEQLQDPLKGRPAQGWLRSYVSSVALSAHQLIRLWALLARPRVVFVVYHDNKDVLGRFFCLRTIQLGKRLRLMDDFFCPASPWFFGIGLIYCGPTTGLALCVGTAPVLSDATPEHLRQLPARVRAAFPSARAVALAGRLPGRVLASGGALAPVVVDGVAGTVFTVAESARSLREQLPKERREGATVAILGGGGFLGSRLVPILAADYSSGKAPASTPASTPAAAGAGAADAAAAASEALNNAAAGGGRGGGPARLESVAETPEGTDSDSATDDTAAADQDEGRLAWGGGCRVIALDTCFKGRRVEGGVLRTSDPRDLSAADVVLVITARGNDAADAARHAAPGQQWGDDTHPEMGAAVLHELRARGAEVHKVMAGREGARATRFFPPLPGWPSGGTPGCLLAALVTAETGRGWDGCCPAAEGGRRGGGKRRARAAAAGGGVAAYEEFAAAARRLGFTAVLKPHKPYLD